MIYLTKSLIVKINKTILVIKRIVSLSLVFNLKIKDAKRAAKKRNKKIKMKMMNKYNINRRKY